MRFMLECPLRTATGTGCVLRPGLWLAGLRFCAQQRGGGCLVRAQGAHLGDEQYRQMIDSEASCGSLPGG